MAAPNITKEDIAWSVRWGMVLVKIKEGSAADANIQLTRQECVDLLRGLNILRQSAKPEDRDG